MRYKVVINHEGTDKVEIMEKFFKLTRPNVIALITLIKRLGGESLPLDKQITVYSMDEDSNVTQKMDITTFKEY